MIMTRLHFNSGFGPKEFSAIYNWTLNSINHTTDFSPIVIGKVHESPVTPLGVISATLLAVLLTSSNSFSKFTNVTKSQQLPQWILLFLLLISLTPVLTVLACYRRVVSWFLKHTLEAEFVELMEGPDAVWNLNDVSRPIISVLAEVESPRGANILLEDIQAALQTILKLCPKLTWKRRSSSLGYSFWERRREQIPLKEHIRWLPEDTLGAGETISMSTLQGLLSDISSAPLPENDSSCWEILVGSSRIANEEYGDKKVYPIFIRIHHSIGDGVSLMELLLKGLSSNCTSDQKWKGSCFLEKGACVDGVQNFDEKYIQLAIDDEDCDISSRKQNKGQSKFCVPRLDQKKILQYWSKCCRIPKCIMNSLHTSYALMTTAMSLSREKRDVSTLDRNQLTGQKFFASYRDNPNDSLLSMIKNIKSQTKGIRFTDVFLTALSGALFKYFKAVSGTVPGNVSIVIPVYVKNLFGKYDHICLAEDDKTLFVEEKSIDLKNCFSLGILKLPIQSGDKISLQARLQNVSKSVSSLYNSGQFLLNVIFLRWMAAILPGNLLNIFLKSAGVTTMVVSNLIGPDSSLLIAGHPLENLTFWVPNRGSTGVGVSILSYNNRLQVGIIMDHAVATTNEEVQQLLNEIVSQLQKMPVDCCEEETKEIIY